MRSMFFFCLVVFFVAGVNVSAYAEIAIPYRFTAGDTVKAYEVNSNFRVLSEEINNIIERLRQQKLMQGGAGPQGKPGTPGPQGEPGPQGLKGEPGVSEIAPEVLKALMQKIKAIEESKTLTAGSETLVERLDALEKLVSAQASMIKNQRKLIRKMSNDVNDIRKISNPMSISENGRDFYFSGVNVHIVNGTGTTFGDANGLGNLIIGYNELRGWENAENIRIGSHNLSIGRGNNYSSFGGLVVGYGNSISSLYSSVVGGSRNISSGPYSSVSGGNNNSASGIASSVTGGNNNTATGEFSVISGGRKNIAAGAYSSVAGGDNKTADWNYAHLP